MPGDNQYRRHQPETLRLRGVVPSLTVSDLEKSVAWYRDKIGFHVEETHERDGKVAGYTLVAGAQRIFLSQDDWAKGRDRVKGVGFRLYLETAQDVDILATAIKKRGGKLASGPSDQPWGGRAFSLVDPDGFALTVTSEA
ncbi:MAG: hypothetical protein FIA95_13315 [Gemmatimonadetes bacterium]|nr:hypothetical protein [Gemmatimonadota bacterium]